MITLMNINKSFEQKSVLYDINFNIPENSIKTLVGPNGIGKTTLLNTLCGFIYPDKGKIICDNSNLRKDIFTVLSGSLQLYARSTVKEFAWFWVYYYTFW